MRILFAVFAVAAVLASASASYAEKRLFIVSSNVDGYGVDRCLATSAACGAAIAKSYCRTHEFKHAVSYRKVDRSDVTGAVPNTSADECRGQGCDDFVAIECAR